MQSKPQALSLRCPCCAMIIPIIARDCDIVTCPLCGASGEIHNSSALNLNTNRQFAVRMFELGQTPPITQ